MPLIRISTINNICPGIDEGAIMHSLPRELRHALYLSRYLELIQKNEYFSFVESDVVAQILERSKRMV